MHHSKRSVYVPASVYRKPAGYFVAPILGITRTTTTAAAAMTTNHTTLDSPSTLINQLKFMRTKMARWLLLLIYFFFFIIINSA